MTQIGLANVKNVGVQDKEVVGQTKILTVGEKYEIVVGLLSLRLAKDGSVTITGTNLLANFSETIKMIAPFILLNYSDVDGSETEGTS